MWIIIAMYLLARVSLRVYVSVFVCLLVCLSVCLSTKKLEKNYRPEINV